MSAEPKQKPSAEELWEKAGYFAERAEDARSAADKELSIDTRAAHQAYLRGRVRRRLERRIARWKAEHPDPGARE
jgi:hypothetical protein